MYFDKSVEKLQKERTRLKNY